jgi:hypothetical protein
MKVMHYHEEGHSDASQAARLMKQVMHHQRRVVLHHYKIIVLKLVHKKKDTVNESNTLI